MSEKIQLEDIIPDELMGMRIDQALAKMFPEYSRGQLTKWLKAGDVLVNGQLLKPKESIQGGEKVTIGTELQVQDESWLAETIALDIIYEDDDVIIINKPAGMVVHPGAGNHQGTLVNALLAHAPQLANIPRAGIVHRIDKATTGLLMIAKTLTAHNSLVSQLQARSVKREYLAVACGVFTAGGTVDEAIGRHSIDRKRMAVSATGKPSVTHYRVEQRYRAHTLIKCKLETGRTHQIRVHMAHIRHPLLGDPVYGGRFKQAKGMTESCREVIQNFRRQALHAGLLGFIHPTTGEEVSWQIDLPDDMQQLVDALAADAEMID
ncbi:MAG: 23S rRNA pseudouridine(1911/1915/1917) synthase RluD [Pseudomonadota bacterium]|jgi:23S rRNA pseudouridine1911/1915/1917 synthase|uniref:23S rRNA pseudouridine(1911/1915/1917) synthase RluD n=1 Tax=Methylophaga TaxID=40222 RepID=UPI001775DD46|nr:MULTISPECIES: 23S rRNA pseudouridine(1911/1915/1917) synthase RluD [Methylophaga]MEC9411691.1 23S rRNA pseudouridine(1911/1915/1917) synthase RluD [Pseudomonadota bacterium]HIC46934.1 23S rRNA pseudouridine(1911/1915/1917) synthase RluD [Methylophaga sp.]HIM39345.1 23S rRNA pseudouridine(1911/1915/1917) synthase RluD [Methylophaga aminisulfidivorans]